MKRKALGAFVGLVLVTAALSAQEPRITFTAPNTGDVFLRGTTVTIRWTHSAYYDANPGQHGILYCGWQQIGTPVPVKQDQFVWTVGLKSDGTWLAPGVYEITMESLDYDALDGPNITIGLLEFRPEFLRRRVEFKKIPDCPMCYAIDPRAIELQMENLDAVRLELAQNGRRLADLGRLEGGKFSSGPVKIELNARGLKNPTGFELHVFSKSGKLLLKQKIDVALSGR